MASVLALPNIGSTPTFELRYGASMEAQRAANAKATLEAFWPAAKVLEVSAPRTGAVSLRYSSPTRSGRSANQSAVSQLCAAEGGLLNDSEFVLAEVVQQDNVEQVCLSVLDQAVRHLCAAAP